MRRPQALACALFACAAALAPPVAQAAAPRTPAGWRVDPAGTEIAVSQAAIGFQGPLGAALSPAGDQLLAASSGAARIESADLFDLGRRQRTSLVGYHGTKGQSAYYGAAWSADGTRAWVSGGGQNVPHALRVKDGVLTETGTIAAGPFPAGLARGRSRRGERLYVANNLAGLAGGAGNPPGGTVTVIDPATGATEATVDLGSRLQPLGVAFDRTGAKAYVTNWLGRPVSVIDTATEARTADVELSPPSDPLQADHPSAIAANPLRDEVYKANASSDTVSVVDSRNDALAATIDVALVPNGPKGGIADGLAVSPDERTLYVALGGENAVAVVDLDRRETVGFIPTAWYPTALAVTPDGNRLAVVNTSASGAGPNPCGGLTPLNCPPPDPNTDRPGSEDSQYSGSMIKGSVQTLEIPRGGELRRLTRQVLDDNQVTARRRARPRAPRRSAT